MLSSVLLQLLLVVLWLPSLEGLALRPSQPLELHAARRGFAAILVVMVLVCYLPTRNGFAALFVAAGQSVLLGAGVPALCAVDVTAAPAVGAVLFAAGAWAAYFVVGRERTASPSTSDVERAWRDFRTLYGWLWSVRTVERLNVAAARRDWGLRLTWGGRVELHGDDLRSNDVHGNDVRDDTSEDAGGCREAMKPEAEAALERATRELLRRFVSAAWIAERLPRR